ncbi:hypothetical protein [Vulcanococcus sp. Clear-D1]|uniref:hypothetical protein n=1 Tax=Vulcanococcus sp. Clear-D1 TaxID=2766970 RepID=UPI0019CE90B2|nr:hypothetical protein [Vulcanococcus sp. Clear-D1]MBD1193161.1 hypothetical protein [Vulcanococcus sp. Clear-D1]
MVWPPIAADVEKYALGRIVAMLCWFAGPTAQRLRIPLSLLETSIDYVLPEYASLAALSDFHKIEFLDISQARDLLIRERHTIIVLSRDVEPDEVLSVAHPLVGSQPLTKVKRPPARTSGSTYYYYFGNPDGDVQDAYYAACLTYWVSGGEDKAFLEASRDDLVRQRFRAAAKSCIALFGTGPSLSEALNRDHGDSFNIICNTIIKNRAFTEHLDPQILVASDAHFHFSYHRYSARFLGDLVAFLHNSSASFYTFDKFAAFLRRRVPEIAGRVFGIPAGRKTYGFDFDQEFRVFPGDSVLNMFLLPLGSYLGQEVVLNGFTGRAPSDSFFWSHSELHQYSHLMEDVRQAHPAFFRNRDYGKYANTVDDDLMVRVNAALEAGKGIHSATTSFYRALQP